VKCRYSRVGRLGSRDVIVASALCQWHKMSLVSTQNTISNLLAAEVVISMTQDATFGYYMMCMLGVDVMGWRVQVKVRLTMGSLASSKSLFYFSLNILTLYYMNFELLSY